ncbi:MAG: hypothetical protein ACI9UJ_002425 [bacterium]|jgi:hypothetical protein
MKNLVKDIRKKSGLGLTLLASVAILFTGCTDDTSDSQNHKASFYATDAPIDNVDVDAVFVTVTEIRVDGQKVEGFQKATLELTALTNGKTELLEETEIEANSFSEITVVLDYALDAEGNAPGTYVLKADGTKEAMASASSELSFSKLIKLNAGESNDIVLDFDLRKMVKEDTRGDFELVSKAELESSIRVVKASATGTVEGKLDSISKVKGKAVAYLYAKGEYAITEMQAQGESNIVFKNAVNSAVVANDGSFKLAFTEEGDYEIHIFEYVDTNNDGRMEIKGKIEISAMGSAGLDGFTVGANSKTDINVGIKSIFPL